MRIRILVIDDEESYCEVLKRSLEREAYDVDTADSAETALGYDLSLYQLIIVDIMMERISGFDFAKRVRSNPATEKIPIIFCSALNGEDETVISSSLTYSRFSILASSNLRRASSRVIFLVLFFSIFL